MVKVEEENLLNYSCSIRVCKNTYGDSIIQSHIISSMTLRGETPPKSSSIGGRKISPQSYSKLSPIEITNERKIAC